MKYLTIYVVLLSGSRIHRMFGIVSNNFASYHEQ
jgi:hypothetical protein